MPRTASDVKVAAVCDFGVTMADASILPFADCDKEVVAYEIFARYSGANPAARSASLYSVTAAHSPVDSTLAPA